MPSPAPTDATLTTLSGRVSWRTSRDPTSPRRLPLPRQTGGEDVRSAGACASRPATGPSRCGLAAAGRPGPARPAARLRRQAGIPEAVPRSGRKLVCAVVAVPGVLGVVPAGLALSQLGPDVAARRAGRWCDAAPVRHHSVDHDDRRLHDRSGLHDQIGLHERSRRRWWRGARGQSGTPPRRSAPARSASRPDGSARRAGLRPSATDPLDDAAETGVDARSTSPRRCSVTAGRNRPMGCSSPRARGVSLACPRAIPPTRVVRRSHRGGSRRSDDGHGEENSAVGAENSC